MSFDLYDFIESDPTEGGSTDSINFWITQSIVDSTYTGSFIQALTVPRKSDTNGNLDLVLKEATEFVVQLPSGSSYVYERSKIETRKQFNNYFYLKLLNNILIPSGSLPLGLSSNQFKVGFVPNNSSKFKFSDYDIQGFQVTNNRRSESSLTVDRNQTPTTGIYSAKLVPNNYEALSASFFDNLLDELPERLLTVTQDSNYEVSSWRNVRYNGVKETNLGITGSEPALSFKSFNGVFFPSSSNNQTIKTLISTSLSELESDTTYFTVIGSIPNDKKEASYNFYLSGSTTGVPLPYTNIEELSNDDIYSIFLYREKEDNENIFVKVVNTKVLDRDSSKILRTNNLGRVISITN